MTQIEACLDTLEQIRAAATLEYAHFTAPGERFPMSGKSRAWTDDVRATTVDYRDLYLLEPLDDVITTLRAEIARASRATEDA